MHRCTVQTTPGAWCYTVHWSLPQVSALECAGPETMGLTVYLKSMAYTGLQGGSPLGSRQEPPLSSRQEHCSVLHKPQEYMRPAWRVCGHAGPQAAALEIVTYTQEAFELELEER